MSLPDVAIRLSEAAQVAEMLERAAIAGTVDDASALAAGFSLIARDVRTCIELLEQAGKPAPVRPRRRERLITHRG